MNELFIRVDDAGRHQAYRFASDGLTKVDVAAPFATPREAVDFCKGLLRAPRPVSHPDLARALSGTESRDEAGAPTEAPGPQDASVTSRCAGCGGPLPPGRHGQTRRTCSVACRRTAARRAAAEAAPVDTDGASAVSHLPGPSDAVCPHPDWRIDYYHGGEPVPGAPFGATRMQPICTVCGDPVQVGATTTPDPSSRAGRDTLRAQLEATDPPVSEGSVGVPLSLGF